jgi:hypothetical protein
MRKNTKLNGFVIPQTTSGVILSSSQQPFFVQNSTKILGVAWFPAREELVTERLDPKDAPNVYNYNAYRVTHTSSGTWMSRPDRTLSTFIPHHLPAPSTFFNTLPRSSTG